MLIIHFYKVSASIFSGVCDPFDYRCWRVKAVFSKILLLLLYYYYHTTTTATDDNDDVLVARVLNVDPFNDFLNLHLKVSLATLHHTHTHTRARTHTLTHTQTPRWRLRQSAGSPAEHFQSYECSKYNKNVQLLPLLFYFNQS